MIELDSSKERLVLILALIASMAIFVIWVKNHQNEVISMMGNTTDVITSTENVIITKESSEVQAENENRYTTAISTVSVTKPQLVLTVLDMGPLRVVEVTTSSCKLQWRKPYNDSEIIMYATL
ncbi:uncharacterized protein LOC122498243 [Leptopilina heterotoma]|uniref:uncharacterized protein LOC122498243 n=1 Tax=Leptopilina heterotoma TaxID=63436 RepID=UPI001CA8C5C5|nr:uncharacterized protein LOC122498243 [Leptopilina heterotoma]